MSVGKIVGVLKGKFHKNNKCSIVYTFLSRLREKGYVDSYKNGAPYYYQMYQAQFLKNNSDTRNHFWDNEAKKLLVTAFVQRQNYTEEKRKKYRN